MQLYRSLSKWHNAVHGRKFTEFQPEWHSHMHKKSAQTTQRLCVNRQVRQGTAQTPCRPTVVKNYLIQLFTNHSMHEPLHDQSYRSNSQ